VAVICTSRDQLRLAQPYNQTRAVVMTMGALHAGHAALIDAARAQVGPQGHVTVTIFVNPLQFGPHEDFARYPRTPEADSDLAAAHGADLIYLPTVAEVFGSDEGPHEDAMVILPGRLGRRWEGERRPGHFAGVLTVVMTLLHLTRAEIALFGEKDYQQLTLIRAMAERFALGVRIVGVPTVRDQDGLALSSRNVYLSPAEREQATAIPGALFAAQRAAEAGAETEAVATVAADRLRNAGLTPDYLALTDPAMGPAPSTGEARLLVAVPVGSTRLLDNVRIVLRSVA
jgi:pantoate--beta-alanine ligase